MQTFQQVQKSLTEFVRDPVENPGPAGIESRRLGIYRDLLFKNIEGSLSNSFPVLRSIFSDESWLQMVRDFMRQHRCQSPYFVDLAEEFLDYLNNERQCASDPEFLRELAYYEWVELALDVAEEELPAPQELPDDLLNASLRVSPLAWPLAFSFPVHLIGSQFQPAELAGEPTCIVVYRNRSDEVKFLESNPVTLRLLELLDADAPTPAAALQRIAEEIGGEPTAIIEHGKALLAQLLELDILYL